LEEGVSCNVTWFLRESWYTVVTQLVVIGMAEFDVLLVGMYVKDGDLADYGAAKNLIAVVRSPLLMVSIFLGPFIAELYYSNKIGQLEKLLRGSATLIGLPSLIAAILFICFPGMILEQTYGDSFHGAIPLLRILTIGTIVFVFTGCNGLTLVMTGHQRELMICSVVVLLLYIILAPMVISHAGVIGGAWLNSTLVAVLNLIVTIMVRIKVNIWTTASPSYAILKQSLLSIFQKPVASLK
jgi:O-antigen/teichoic acid export membrane protein